MFPQFFTLEETLRVVRKHNEELGVDAFIIAERDGLTIFNYVVSFDGTFPPFTGDPDRDREIGILRECRGLTFNTHTGKVVARKFHKFFNVGQRDETQLHAIDWSVPHIIMEKLDGSMITPVDVSGPKEYRTKIEWHTKMGNTDVAKQAAEYVSTHPEYVALADVCHTMGVTPIFEWCSRQQRIVIDYPEDRLTLLALRDKEFGDYKARHTVEHIGAYFGIPVVNVIDTTVTDPTEFMADAMALTDQEGYVIQFENGLMVKVKAEEYLRQHSAVDALSHEKNVWGMILDDTIDDIMSFISGENRVAVQSFHEAFEREIQNSADRLIERYIPILERVVGHRDYTKPLEGPEQKKAFALIISGPEFNERFERTLMFGMSNGNDTPVNIIKKLLKNNSSTSNKVEEMRHFVGGIKWFEYRYLKDDNA